MIHPTAIVEAGASLGKDTRVWHFTHIMPQARIGAHCILGQNVFIANGVVLGNGVKVQNNVSIYEGVICEDDVFLGPSMVFTNILNPRSAISRKKEYQTTYVAQGASIGANATILCGIRLGRYCLVGAGSVVLQDVAPYALVVGNPVRQIGWVSEYGHRLHFDAQGQATCTESKQVYQLSDSQVIRVA